MDRMYTSFWDIYRPLKSLTCESARPMTDESFSMRNDSSESSGGTMPSLPQVPGTDSYDKNHADTCDLTANPAPDQRRIGKYSPSGRDWARGDGCGLCGI